MKSYSFRLFFPLAAMIVMLSFHAAAQEGSIQTCINFSDSYAKVILKKGKATQQDIREIVTLTSLVTGYAYALQDVFGARLIGWGEQQNELALLKEVFRYCSKYPQYSVQKALRSIPQFVDTFKAIQMQEDNRCFAYIDQNRPRICPAADATNQVTVSQQAPVDSLYTVPVSASVAAGTSPVIDAPVRQVEK